MYSFFGQVASITREGWIKFKKISLTNFNPLFKWYMIGSECRKRRNNQFNNVLLNVQDKINYNKITKIKEERITNSIYTDSSHFLCLRLVLKQSTWDFPLSLYRLWTHTLGSLTLVFKIFKSLETNSFLITTEFIRWIEKFLSFRVDDTNWSSINNFE